MSGQRYMAWVGAMFLSRSQSTAFLTDYVTSNGVFVRTDSPPQIMELLRIEFTLPPHSTKIVMHGMATRIVMPSAKCNTPGVEIAFFAKGGDASILWDQFIAHVRDKHPESLTRPVMLARGATDQVRRAHPRLVPATPIEVVGGRAGSFMVGDISDGGMFIKTTDDLAVGADLRVTLRDPRGRAAIPVECVVRRRVAGPSPNAGVGVEFRNMNDEMRRVLRELMEGVGATESVQAHRVEVLAAPSLAG